jgi:hypothetical protein
MIFLILNQNYLDTNEIDQNSFIGIIENAVNEEKALQRARTKFTLTKDQFIIAEECQINDIR